MSCDMCAEVQCTNSQKTKFYNSYSPNFNNICDKENGYFRITEDDNGQYYLQFHAEFPEMTNSGWVDIAIDYCPNCGEPLTPSEPLTLEELKQMDGEPVYIVAASRRSNVPTRWMLLIGERTEALPEFTPDTYPAFLFQSTSGISQLYSQKNYRKTWLAYVRKPREE